MGKAKKQNSKIKRARRAWRALGRDARSAIEETVRELAPVNTRGIPPRIFFRPPLTEVSNTKEEVKQ